MRPQGLIHKAEGWKLGNSKVGPSDMLYFLPVRGYPVPHRCQKPHEPVTSASVGGRAGVSPLTSVRRGCRMALQGQELPGPSAFSPPQ